MATIVVSGKLAQFGSRLLVPVSDAMLAQFAANFQAAAVAVPAATQQDLLLGETTAIRMVQGSQAPGALPAHDGAKPAAPAVKELNALAMKAPVCSFMPCSPIEPMLSSASPIGKPGVTLLMTMSRASGLPSFMVRPLSVMVCALASTVGAPAKAPL